MCDIAATVKVYGFTGAGPTAATVDNADSASFRFGRDDLLISASTAPIPIPTATGTNFSWLKWLALYVTAGGGSTSLLNRKINMSAALPTGIAMWYIAQTTYTQNTGTTGTAVGNYPAASASNGATPANQNAVAFVAMTTSAVSYDSATVAATNSTANGKYVMLTLGVDNTCVSGGGATSLGNLVFTYDEQKLSRHSCRNDSAFPDIEERLALRRICRLPVSMRRGAGLDF